MSAIELKKMAEMEYHLPETFLKIIKEDPEYAIYLLHGEAYFSLLDPTVNGTSVMSITPVSIGVQQKLK